jgi:hypothetical protein
MSYRLPIALLLSLVLPAFAVPPGTIPRPAELQNPAVNTGRVPPGAARRLTPEQAKQLAAHMQEILRRPENEVIALPHGQPVLVGSLKQTLARNVHVIGVPHPQRMKLLNAQLNVRQQVNRDAAAAHAALAAQLGSQPPAAATPAGGGAARATAPAEPPFLDATGNDARFAAAMRARDGRLPIMPQLRAGVWGVNQHSSGFVLTPGSNLTLTGNGFGVAPSSAPAMTHLPGRVLPPGHVRALSPGFPNGALALVVNGWSPQEISASVPGGLRSIADLSGVVLEVTTPDGHVYRSNPGSFYAAREEIPVPIAYFNPTSDPYNPLLDFSASPNWPGIKLASDGTVSRQNSQDDDFDCPKPGEDAFTFITTDLGNGFEVSGVTLRVAAPVTTGDGDGIGNAGDHVFFPGYGIVGWYQHQGNSGANYWAVGVNWGVWRWHRSPNVITDLAAVVSNELPDDATTLLLNAAYLGMAVTGGAGALLAGWEQTELGVLDIHNSKNGCWSSYVLGITAVGPAGLSPQ